MSSTPTHIKERKENENEEKGWRGHEEEKMSWEEMARKRGDCGVGAYRWKEGWRLNK